MKLNFILSVFLSFTAIISQAQRIDAENISFQILKEPVNAVEAQRSEEHTSELQSP